MGGQACSHGSERPTGPRAHARTVWPAPNLLLPDEQAASSTNRRRSSLSGEDAIARETRRIVNTQSEVAQPPSPLAALA